MQETVYTNYIATSPDKVWNALTDGAITPRYFFGRRIESDWKVGSTVLYYVPSETDATASAAPVAAPEPGSAEEAQQATSRKMRNFAALLDITKKVNSELDQQRLLETIIDKAIELIHAERGFLILVENNERVFKVARRHDKTTVENPERAISKSVNL